jgi:hypothetical protein
MEFPYKNGEKVDFYGIKFAWSELHHTPEDLSSLLRTYDYTSTEALEGLDKIVPPTVFPARKDIQDTHEPKDKKQQRDIFRLVKKHAADDKKIQELWDEVNTVPDWVDWEQIERGQKVFWRYGGPAITSVCKQLD